MLKHRAIGGGEGRHHGQVNQIIKRNSCFNLIFIHIAVVVLVGHIVEQFSAPLLSRCSPMPPHPAEEVR